MSHVSHLYHSSESVLFRYKQALTYCCFSNHLNRFSYRHVVPLMLPTWFQPALLSLSRDGFFRITYNRTHLLRDLSAGALVGVIALPLSMALAIASGCQPEQGLWTAIIAGFLISFLGGSRVQIGGPAGAFVGLCAVGVNQFGYAGLALATMMAGFFMLLMGWARLGKAVSFIPLPVVIGFTSGIALILFSTQISAALGLPEPARPMEHLHERALYIATHIDALNFRALLVCVITVGIIVLMRRISAHIPGALMAIILVTLAVHFLGWDAPNQTNAATLNATHLDTIASRYGAIPSVLPTPSVPSFGLPESATWLDYVDRLRELFMLALAIALLGSIESLLSAVVCDGMTGYRHDSNSEIIAQGVANIASPLFMGLPATGVIARSSANVRAGATTPIAGMTHAVVILLLMLCAAPLIGHIPLAALAGVLMVVCWHMAELRHWPASFKSSHRDAILLMVTFLLTAFVGLVEALMASAVIIIGLRAWTKSR
jgi:sulfate permease, SulP family